LDIRTDEIIKRYEGNPILTIKDIPVSCNAVFNSGIIKFNKKYAMMLRVENIDRSQHFRMAWSQDGYKFDVSKEPIVFSNDNELREYGGFYYDPRITYLEGEYYIFFCVHSDRYGIRIGIASTKDFKIFNWLGFGSEPDNRNGVLFPEKIGGLYARLDRPHGKDGTKCNIWISFSPDFVFWGKSKCIAETRTHHWDDAYIGPGAVPIKTEKGWLEIYHGVYKSCNGYIYRLGCMLLDLKKPWKVIGRSKGYILTPRENCEIIGDVANVVFTCGAVLEDNGEVKVYYGGADTVMCVGTAEINDFINCCQ